MRSRVATRDLSKMSIFNKKIIGPVKKQEIIIHIQGEKQSKETISRRNQMLDLADKNLKVVINMFKE